MRAHRSGPLQVGGWGGAVQRHVLSSAAAAGGLLAAAECVRIALGHCRWWQVGLGVAAHVDHWLLLLPPCCADPCAVLSFPLHPLPCRLLEEQGLTLSPVLSKLVRPSVEEALEFNIIRIEDSVATMVAVDHWLLLPLPHAMLPLPLPPPLQATGRARPHSLFSAVEARPAQCGGGVGVQHHPLLEEQGLTLSPVLSKLVRPSVEEALEFNIIRIEDSVATMVAVDDWVLLPLPHGAAATGRVRALQQTLGPGLMHLRLSSSGQRFYLLLVDLVEDILPVISLQLFGRILDRLASLFESYVALLQKALPSPSDDDDEEEDGGNGGEGGKDKGGEKENGAGEEPWQDGSVRTAEDEQQQLALLGNASALADDLLPRLAQRLTLAAGEEGGGGGGRAGRKQGGADPDRRLSAGGRCAFLSLSESSFFIPFTLPPR
ncbi:unnamed protein product, partial [Closterium sp. NIES-54]